MSIKGWATKEGTELFHLNVGLPPWAVRTLFGLRLAAIGVGTYLGETDEATDTLQRQAITSLLALGCNVIDCAPNYRNGRAEKSVGEALVHVADSIPRSAIFITTKVGLVPENFEPPASFALGPDRSCYDPQYLRLSLEGSLERLQLATVDCVFVHNLELLRLADIGAFPKRFASVAQSMESMVADGLTRSWGISSWQGFRVDETQPDYLSLDMLRSYLVPNLRYIQLPVGLWGSEALTGRWQGGENILSRARELGVFASAPLLQGELAHILRHHGNLIGQAVNFVRDTAGVDIVLLGIKKPEHVCAWREMQLQEPRDVTDSFLTILDSLSAGPNFT